MTRFVITSGHPNLHGTIGHWERYDSIGVVLGFKDEKGFLSSCSFPLDTVRELDETAIVAGDEVVLIADANGYQRATIGKVYPVLDRKDCKPNGFHSYNDVGEDWWPVEEWVVKVKPLPQPEVKQEAEKVDSNAAIIEQIRKRLDEEQDKHRAHYGGRDVVDVLNRVLAFKQSCVAGTISGAKQFQDDVLSFLRAFELTLEMVGNGHTHAEKAARLRGVIELVGTAARRIRERQVDDMNSLTYRMLDDVFRSDFPVRHFVEKARDSEARATEAEKWLGAVKSVLTAEQVASLEKSQGSDVPF